MRAGGVELTELPPSARSGEPPEPSLVGLAPGETALLSGDDLARLARQLPSRCVGKAWKLLFSTSQHGYALSTLYSRARGHGPTVIVVMDDASHVFGAFASRDWSGNDLATSTLQFSLSSLARGAAGGGGAGAGAAAAAETSSYFGSGESFLFRARPESDHFRWTGRNSEFQLARRDLIAIGGGVSACCRVPAAAQQRCRARPPVLIPPPPSPRAALTQGGKFGLCLDASLDRGWTGTCDTYGNPPLAASEVFRALRVEVWGFVLPHEASKSASRCSRLRASADIRSWEHSKTQPSPRSPSDPPQAAPLAAWRSASLASWAAA
jgi:hypothetical protein